MVVSLFFRQRSAVRKVFLRNVVGSRRPRVVRLCVALLLLGARAAATEPLRAPTAASEPAPEAQEPASEPALIRYGAGAPLVWQPEFRRFGWVDGVVMGGFVAAAGVAALIGPDEDDPARGGVWFDEDFRDKVRSNDVAVRRTWRDVSDTLIALNLAYPYVADALVNAAWYRDSPDVAWQMALLDTEALAVTLGIHQVVANSVSRERPFVRTCGTSELSENNDDCEDVDRYRSYFSAHTAYAFTAASATCTHHAYLPLHGGHGEWVPCVTGLVLAGATGFARIGADMHYATDVLTGAAVGSFVGWFVPWVHYATGYRENLPSPVAFRVSLVPYGRGVGLVGAF